MIRKVLCTKVSSTGFIRIIGLELIVSVLENCELFLDLDTNISGEVVVSKLTTFSWRGTQTRRN